MGNKINRFSKIIKEEGFLSFLLKALRYFNKNIFGISKLVIFEFDLEQSVPRVVSDFPLSFRMALGKDIDLMDEEHYDYDQYAKQYSKNRLIKGDRCVLAIYNGTVIGYGWAMKDYMELSQYNYIRLCKNKVYFYRCFVRKEYRGNKIERAIYNYLADMLKKEGKRFVLLTVDTSNKSALKTKEKDKKNIIGYIIHFNFFGLHYDHVKKKVLQYLQNSEN